MKIIYTIVLLLLMGQQVNAECSSGALSYYKIPTDTDKPVIVLEGSWNKQDFILAINKKFQLALTNGHEEILLNVLDKCVSDYYLTQALLKPAKALEVGNDYKLKIIKTGTIEDEAFILSMLEEVLIKTDSKFGNNRSTIKFLAAPKIVSKSYEEYGCGPAKSLSINLNVSKQPFLVKTDLTELESGRTISYYLPTNDYGIIEIGHGMCGGSFTFIDKAKYRVVFSLIDGDGNYVSQKLQSLSFVWKDNNDI